MKTTLRFVTLAVALTALLVLGLPNPAQAVTSKTFCISGLSTGAGWSWGLISMGALRDTAKGISVPAGKGCADLTAAFAASVDASRGCSAKVTAGNPCCFTICCDYDFDLWVGDAAGTPASGCDVSNTPGGCSFNPLIVQNDDYPSTCSDVVEPGDPEPEPVDPVEEPIGEPGG